MKKISKKQALAVLAVVIVIILGFCSYLFINDKLNNTLYFVVFDSNGGSRVSGQKVKINELVIEPVAPTKEGYTFEYWMLYNERYDFNMKVNKNMTLVARWIENE